MSVIQPEEHPFSEETISERLWRAVLERDSRFDGIVYYAVSTTGVFCRPVCPSRRPRFENVSFFVTPDDAERSGYRACKRCRPGRADQDDADGHHGLVLRACRAIEATESGSPTLAQVADAIGVSPECMRGLFRRTLGITHKQYADVVRLGRLKAAMADGESVAAASYGAGFGSSSRVYGRAAARLGMTPATYRRRGRGERIGFTTWRSRLGAVLLAGTRKGLCSVKLGDDASMLVAELKSEFCDASLVEDPSGLPCDIVERYLEGQMRLPADLPTDVLGTVFQARVWAVLREIPSGETRTYAEVAAAIGSPRAVRAVASACARNPVALVVPCHRVVPKGAARDAGKYRWGAERKSELLRLEKTVEGRSAGEGPSGAKQAGKTCPEMGHRSNGEEER